MQQLHEDQSRLMTYGQLVGAVTTVTVSTHSFCFLLLLVASHFHCPTVNRKWGSGQEISHSRLRSRMCFTETRTFDVEGQTLNKGELRWKKQNN